MGFIHLRASNLGKKGVQSVETLASLAVQLNQGKPDLPSFYSALIAAEGDSEDTKVHLPECQDRLERLDAGIHQATTTKTRLGRILKDLQDSRELEAQKIEEKRASVPNLEKKGQEYSEKIRRMEV